MLHEFYGIRLRYYARRKEWLEGQLQAEADKLSNQARFILEKCDKGLVVENKKRKVLVEELIKRGSFVYTLPASYYESSQTTYGMFAVFHS